MTIPFEFVARVWQHSGTPGGWYFVSLPQKMSGEIRYLFKEREEGWGRLKIRANIKDTEWETALWFDIKQNTYLLPLKTEIRRRKNISAGDQIKINIGISL